MSTNLLSNPLFIQGSVVGYKSQTASALGTLRTLIVSKIRWVNPGISQTISIGDPISGLVLWSAKSNTAGEDILDDLSADPIVFQDFAIDIFPGGTLLLYTRGC